MKYGHPDSPEAQEAAAHRLAHEKGAERADWLNLWRVYERCVEIAERVWAAKLETASQQQQKLAEEMRDRAIDVGVEPLSGAVFGGEAKAEIPVPLFTPRDRQQFLKEVAATLLTSADRRQLNVRFPKEKPTATPSEATNGEASSGVDESEQEQLIDAALAPDGQRVQ